VLGAPVPDDVIGRIFERLELRPAQTAQGWTVEIPHFESISPAKNTCSKKSHGIMDSTNSPRPYHRRADLAPCFPTRTGHAGYET
jgi:hypothetical protein